MNDQDFDVLKTSSSGSQSHYVAFLVRCWQEGQYRRYLLETVETREKQGFESLDALLVYIQDILKGE